MAEWIPLPWLLKMSIYDVSIGVVTRVVDRVDVMCHGISELKSELKFPYHNIVGIDVICNGDVLLFCVKKRCLIIQFKRMMSLDKQCSIPDSLLQFLQDRNITFVGTTNIDQKKLQYSFFKTLEFKKFMDVCCFGAKILKKPKLLTGTVEELIIDAGIDIKRLTFNNDKVRALWQLSPVLSEEEVKYAMSEVYLSYQIVIALLDMI